MHVKVLLFLWTIDLDLLDVIVFCYAHDKIYAIFGKNYVKILIYVSAPWSQRKVIKIRLDLLPLAD